MAKLLETLIIDDQPVSICGSFEPRFQPLYDAFVVNFCDRRELGAAVAIYKEGRKVVDLWGGHMDEARQRPWEEHSIVSMASVVKGMLAFMLHMLADRGKLDYDAPVATYWPEFAQNGKERITVRQAISHHAAIHFMDAAQPGDYFRWARMTDAIARQQPEWEAGARGVYHTVSITFIMGKLIQCVSGEYPWDIFRREITEKLGVEYHIRLSDKELQLHGPDFETEHFVKDAKIPPDVMSRFLAGMEDPQKAQQSLSPSERKDVPYQLSAGNARGGAKLFAFAAMGGELNGVRVLSPRTIELMTQVQWHEKCAVWGTPMRTALGLLLNNDFFYVGPNLDAFGTAGAGGSFAFADPENQLSMGYSVNRWWPALALGDRARSLVDAAYVSL